MKKRNYIALLLILMSALILETCGPVVLSSRSESPPPWFYPNRVEMVRYVYFPEYSIYYDLTLSNYLYLNNGVWMRVKVLPPRYHNINLNRSKYVRVKGYRGDNIRTYHNENNVRSNTRTSRRTNTARTRRN
ncbi:hypothetical protein [Winogradskyella thalassocola]|uniref:Uncharacterized protein n=1 Tax=Winogradskyella thalassocola TaxID=262004 RepID=A0A1G8JEN1_9FLAO|nr:hypothetical protein [Winogradskyella thalassocola]SDI29447.1 hypothetical protein SAMN04489796_10958 [Winogradskyella thalassocola]